jgi:hypothetical protein
MPRGARTYLYQFNSFWYMPENHSCLWGDDIYQMVGN